MGAHEEVEQRLACDMVKNTGRSVRPIHGLNCVTVGSHVTSGLLCPHLHRVDNT